MAIQTLLRLPAVKARCGLGRSTLYSLIARGDFPAPIHISERAVAWPSDRIEAWIANRIASSRKTMD